ncbi:putative reverse transcriptase domain-containing protein, partial [Tanacetum coccineum]
MTITRSGMTPEAIEELVNRRVEEALAAHEATRAANALETKNQSQNGSDSDNRNGGNGNGRNENPDENVRGDRPVARECTYQDFMKCQPLNFNGRKGVVGLIGWFEKMETVFHIKISRVDHDVYQNGPARGISVEKFIGGLPDNIQGNGYAVRNAKNKRRLDNNYGNNRGQQPPHKRQNTGGQNVARAYVAGNNEKREYKGHYRKDCPKIKNQNRGDKARVPDARGKAYVLGGGDANPGSNTVTGTFLLNNHHAYMLFDSGADRSFVSNTFSTLLDITPYALNVSYAVELADGRTSETNTVLKGCTLGLLGHPFNIDLMPIDLGSFDVIIGMDWLAKNHAVIVCDEKIVRIPYGNEILIVQGDKSAKEKKSKLSLISCEKAQKYMEKGCQLFLAQVTVKE